MVNSLSCPPTRPENGPPHPVRKISGNAPMIFASPKGRRSRSSTRWAKRPRSVFSSFWSTPPPFWLKGMPSMRKLFTKASGPLPSERACSFWSSEFSWPASCVPNASSWTSQSTWKKQTFVFPKLARRPEWERWPPTWCMPWRAHWWDSRIWNSIQTSIWKQPKKTCARPPGRSKTWLRKPSTPSGNATWTRRAIPSKPRKFSTWPPISSMRKVLSRGSACSRATHRLKKSTTSKPTWFYPSSITWSKTRLIPGPPSRSFFSPNKRTAPWFFPFGTMAPG